MRNNTISTYLILTAISTLAILSACSGVRVSEYAYNDSYQVNKPMKAEGCYDASVLLGVDLARARDIAKRVLAAVDSTITEENGTLLKAYRNRNIGLIVGSGGEDLSIALKAVGDNKTFATIATKTTFVGRAGQKAWSCQIADEMVKIASN